MYNISNLGFLNLWWKSISRHTVSTGIFYKSCESVLFAWWVILLKKLTKWIKHFITGFQTHLSICHINRCIALVKELYYNISHKQSWGFIKAMSEASNTYSANSLYVLLQISTLFALFALFALFNTWNISNIWLDFVLLNIQITPTYVNQT